MHIRPATPADGAFLARIFILAGRAHVDRGIWEVVLDRSAADCATFLQHLVVTSIPHLFHYSRYLIAEIEGIDPVGGLGGYDPESHGYKALQQAIPEAAGKLGFPDPASTGSSERTARILSCLPKETAGAWVIDSVAVLPEYRCRGIAGHLLAAMLAEGSKQGYPLAQVNMYIGNEPALNLYRKAGFRVLEEVRDAYFEKQIGSPGMLSLVRPLQ